MAASIERELRVDWNRQVQYGRFFRGEWSATLEGVDEPVRGELAFEWRVQDGEHEFVRQIFFDEDGTYCDSTQRIADASQWTFECKRRQLSSDEPHALGRASYAVHTSTGSLNIDLRPTTPTLRERLNAWAALDGTRWQDVVRPVDLQDALRGRVFCASGTLAEPNTVVTWRVNEERESVGAFVATLHAERSQMLESSDEESWFARINAANDADAEGTTNEVTNTWRFERTTFRAEVQIDGATQALTVRSPSEAQREVLRCHEIAGGTRAAHTQCRTEERRAGPHAPLPTPRFVRHPGSKIEPTT